MNLVCFAVPEEARPFRRAQPHGVETLITGMGRANAAAAFSRRLTATAPQLVLTCGFAGGLDPRLRRGTVVFDADPDPGLAESLAAAGAVPARVHCADRVATTARDKQRLRDATGSDAVEMESAVIRELCRQRGIPSATVRVISDEAGEDLPVDFNACLDSRQQLSLLRLLAHLARHPRVIPGLLRLQRHCAFAAGNLARVLQAALAGH